MDEAFFIQYLTKTFENVKQVVSEGNSFFFYGSDHKMPFTTIMANSKYDQNSNLDRDGIFRLNLGLSKSTYLSLFPSSPESTKSYDYTTLDRLMPHPEYNQMFWICVLNPSPTTFQTVKPLLAEAYDLAANRTAKRSEFQKES